MKNSNGQMRWQYAYSTNKSAFLLFFFFFISQSAVSTEANIGLPITKVAPVALGFPIELEFRNCSFCGWRKPGRPEEKPSKQGREPTSNSTHI